MSPWKLPWLQPFDWAGANASTKKIISFVCPLRNRKWEKCCKCPFLVFGSRRTKPKETFFFAFFPPTIFSTFFLLYLFYYCSRQWAKESVGWREMDRKIKEKNASPFLNFILEFCFYCLRFVATLPMCLYFYLIFFLLRVSLAVSWWFEKNERVEFVCVWIIRAPEKIPSLKKKIAEAKQFRRGEKIKRGREKKEEQGNFYFFTRKERRNSESQKLLTIKDVHRVLRRKEVFYKKFYCNKRKFSCEKNNKVEFKKNCLEAEKKLKKNSVKNYFKDRKLWKFHKK